MKFDKKTGLRFHLKLETLQMVLGFDRNSPLPAPVALLTKRRDALSLSLSLSPSNRRETRMKTR